MGPATDVNPGMGILPVGFFTTTVGVRSLQPELTHVLLTGDSRYTSGSWGYVNFDGNGGSASTTEAWLACGYNPSLTTASDWDRWCPAYTNTQHATGPTESWLGDSAPSSGPYFAPRLAWGFGTDGWWLPGSTGTTRSNCADLEEMVTATNGGDYLIPIFDNWTGNGNNARFYMAGLGLFHIDNSPVDCHATDPNTGGQYVRWHIEGGIQAAPRFRVFGRARLYAPYLPARRIPERREQRLFGRCSRRSGQIVLKREAHGGAASAHSYFAEDRAEMRLHRVDAHGEVHGYLGVGEARCYQA
jgi:hypothetical protein